MAARERRALADAVTVLFERYPQRPTTCRYAEGFSWNDASCRQLELLGEMRERAARVGE